MIPYFVWTPIKPEDASTTSLELWIIELALEYQRKLKPIVLEYLHRNVFLETYNLNKGMKTIPYKELINVIENNLRMLVGTDVTHEMQAMVYWQGGLRDDKFLDYSDVNRWFETMNHLIWYINFMSPRYLETNVFYSGVNPDHQVIGIG